MGTTATTIWGVHAGRFGEADPLFKRGRVALGWHDIDDLATIPANRDAFKERVRAAYPHDKPGAIPVAAGQLFRFVHEATVGDLVIWRSKSDRFIHIGRITDPYRYDPAESAAYPHQRQTEWLHAVQPSQVSQGALYEIGSAMSWFSVRNYADEWRAMLGGGAPVKRGPIDDEVDATVPAVAEGIEQTTRDFILKELSRQLKGHPLSWFVAHLLERMGYRMRVSPEGPDGGVDIVAHRDELGFEPPIVRVQVKSGSGSIGQPDVSSLLGTLAHGEFGLLVTLGTFTAPARAFARSKPNLRLVDVDALVELVLAHYETFDSRYKGLLPLKRVYVPDPDLGGHE